MMFILSVTPLILGITVVILALIRKLRPQVVAEESSDSIIDRNNSSDRLMVSSSSRERELTGSLKE